MVTQAVKETEDQVITYDGKVATAFYFANSGGYTMNSEDVWTAAIPYLRAVQDEYAVTTVWNTQITFAELKDKLIGKGYECGDITRVYVSSRCDNNAVRTLTIETTAGNINLSKEKLRSVLGASLVKTSLFAVGADGFPGVGELAVAGSSGLVATSGEVSTATVYVMGENEEVVEAETDDLYVTNGEDIVNSGEYVESTEAGELELSDEPVTTGTLYISGVGNGHGVGLSQLSAIKMAGAPYYYTYDYILKYFYTGVEIQTISEIR
jgi:stage II sporulation protein D